MSPTTMGGRLRRSVRHDHSPTSGDVRELTGLIAAASRNLLTGTSTGQSAGARVATVPEPLVVRIVQRSGDLCDPHVMNSMPRHCRIDTELCYPGHKMVFRSP